MAKLARQTAVEALLQINEEGGYSNVVFHNLALRNKLSAQDTALCSALIYGTLERRLTLDHVISAYSKTPIRKLSPAVREILRISLYQLLYLENIPDSAAVNEGVKLTRLMKAASASGFVNGILRAFLRDGKKIPPVKQGGLAQQWQVEYSCPAELIQRLLQSCTKEQVQALLEHSLGRPTLFARVNTTKITTEELCERLKQEGVEAKADELDGCISLSNTASLEKLPSFQSGLFHIQDKSSQLCARLVEAKPGQRVLDVCAAPGSKSFTISEYMNNEGEVISCDIYPEKLKKIREGAARLGLTIIKVLENDAMIYREDLGLFDRVLCDVPCSGLGIIGRKPEIKYKDPKEFEGLPPVQADILETCSRYVKEGGILTYSTCTVLPEENQKVVEEFLSRHRNFEPVCQREHTQGWYSALFPNMCNSDGFFIATMRRIG
ncbi:MAG: 16S rRNA (cytosine(967)-C(5))-methyltransferase RsmB [Negativibacillus sp.]